MGKSEKGTREGQGTELHPESLFDESPWLLGDSSAWEALIPYAKRVAYKKNSIIYHQNSVAENVYIVKAGRVNLSILSHDGVEKSLYVVSAGSAFGEVPVISGINISGQATAKTDCEVYVVSAPVFLRYVYSDSKTMMALARLTAKKIHLLTGHIELLSFFDINYRVCKMLIYLAHQYGVKTEGGLMIDMRFTHQELASMVGASRVSVTKLLNDLIKAGLIRRKDGKFFIIDTAKLQAHALSTHKEGQDVDWRS